MTSTSDLTEADRIIRFFATFLEHSKDVNYGEAFVVEPWQDDFLREAYKPDPEDPSRRFYKRVFLCIPARNGKSSIAAGLSLWHLLADPFANSPVVLCAAASGQQADVVFGAAATFVTINPALTKKLSVLPSRGTIKYRQRRKGQLGEIRRVNAGEPQNLFGIDASAIILDELHAVPDAVYDTLSTRIYSRQSPFFLSLSTAGGNKAGILGRIFDEASDGWEVIESRDGFLAARDGASRSLIWWYGASDAADITDPHTWTSCNPASWMGEEKLREIYATSKSNESSFRKFHLNQWASGAGALLETGVWAGLRNDEIVIEDGDRVILGVDVAKSRDHTAVAIIGPPKLNGIRPVEAWVIAPDDVDYMPTAAANYIRKLAERLTIDSIVFDPMLFNTEAHELSSEGFQCIEFDFNGKKINQATENFRTLAHSAQICHNGDGTLASHIANCAVKETNSGLSIKKLGADSFKMDAAAALVSACFLVKPASTTPFFYFA